MIVSWNMMERSFIDKCNYQLLLTYWNFYFQFALIIINVITNIYISVLFSNLGFLETISKYWRSCHSVSKIIF